jgi:hypothetical protein
MGFIVVGKEAETLPSNVSDEKGLIDQLKPQMKKPS